MTNAAVGAVKAAIAWLLYAVLLPFKRRKLWLISDRYGRAGDNGEAFFRFVRLSHPEIDARFALSADAPGYGSLKRAGGVVPWRSMRRKVLTLLSDCLISSQFELSFVNPFHGYDWFLRKILRNKPFVFLQHGVTKDDISAWLAARPRKPSAIVAASPRERDAFLSPPYGFSAGEVWLAGFPRFDLLESSPRRTILFMPTWRSCARERRAAADSAATPFAGLLGNGELLSLCRRHGYRIVAALHPNSDSAGLDSLCNDVVSLPGRDDTYRKLFSEGCLLVTDYSSTAFDFAYLRKPVIYLQPDAKTFFSGAHSYSKGYFDYGRDGFGPVETTIAGAVERIGECLRRGCAMEEAYRKRVDGFFAYSDRLNSERVFERISALTRKNPFR